MNLLFGMDDWYEWATAPLRQAFLRPRVVLDASPDHCPAMAALHEAAFPNGWSPDDIERLLANSNVIAQVIRPITWFGLTPEFGAVEGFILVRHAAGEGEILTFAVEPRARGKGHGARLLDSALLKLRQNGVSSVFLEVAETNEAAVKLYARREFTVVGERPAYSSTSDGRKTRALVMRREYG
ncbi:MAG: GNAT family N-acetyltransferase [Pseudomonadota bacterium]